MAIFWPASRVGFLWLWLMPRLYCSYEILWFLTDWLILGRLFMLPADPYVWKLDWICKPVATPFLE